MKNQKSILQKIFLCFFSLAALTSMLNAQVAFIPVNPLTSKDGSVSGTISIDTSEGAKTIKLKHVYAYAWVQNGKLNSVELDFTDEPAPEDYNERKDFLMVMAREGKLNALQVKILSNKKIGDIDLYGKSYREQKTINLPSYITEPQVASPKGRNRKAAPPPPADADEDEDEDSGINLSLEKFSEKEVEGKITLESISGYDNGKDASFEWSATAVFKSPVVNKGDDVMRVKMLPEGFGDVGKAYLSFYNAVIAADAKTAKTLLSEESRKSFEGADEQKSLSRLKELLMPYKYIAPYSHTFEGDQTAQLYIQDAENTPFDKVLFKPGQMGYMPPISLGQQNWGPSPVQGGVGNRRAGKNRNAGSKIAAPPVPQKPMATVIAEARMVLEDNQWRVHWLLFDDPYLAWGRGFEPNALWHLDDYKTETEREQELERIDELPDGVVLPAGGGEPGKAYLAFCRAEKAGDKPSLIKYLTGAQYDLYSQAPVQIKPGAFIWKEENALQYLNLQIVDGRMRDEEAFLSVQALRKGYRTTGKVRMILEDGEWKVEREKWETDYSKKGARPTRPIKN